MIGRFGIVLAAFLVATLPFAAGASQGECAQAFDQCLKQCDTDHAGDTSARAACVPACSGKYAACDAGVAYDKARPWLEEQADKTKRFLEDLMDDLKRDEAPAPEGDTNKSI